MADEKPNTAPASVIWKNLNTILVHGQFPGHMAEAVAQAVQFTNQLAEGEANREKIAKAEAKRARKAGVRVVGDDEAEEPTAELRADEPPTAPVSRNWSYAGGC